MIIYELSLLKYVPTYMCVLARMCITACLCVCVFSTLLLLLLYVCAWLYAIFSLFYSDAFFYFHGSWLCSGSYCCTCCHSSSAAWLAALVTAFVIASACIYFMSAFICLYFSYIFMFLLNILLLLLFLFPSFSLIWHLISPPKVGWGPRHACMKAWQYLCHISVYLCVLMLTHIHTFTYVSIFILMSFAVDTIAYIVSWDISSANVDVRVPNLYPLMLHTEAARYMHTHLYEYTHTCVYICIYIYIFMPSYTHTYI